MMSNKERKYSNILNDYIFFAKQLDNLGFSRRYLGYYMILEIINILVNENVRVVSFTKQVYPLVASRFQKSCCTIERNIRSLIDKSWNMDLMVRLNRYFPEDKKPSCRDFLFMIKNHITNLMV